MRPLLPLTLLALSLGACVSPPAAEIDSSKAPSASPAPSGGTFWPGWAFAEDPALSAGPSDTVSLTAEAAESVRLRYDWGAEETLEWLGSGDGEAVLLNQYGQQVWAVREGAPAQRVTVPAGTYRLTIRNLGPGLVALSRRHGAEGAFLQFQRSGAGGESAMDRWSEAGIETLMEPRVFVHGGGVRRMNLEGRTYEQFKVFDVYMTDINLDRVRVPTHEMAIGGSTASLITMRHAEMPQAFFAHTELTRTDMSDASMPDSDFTQLDGLDIVALRAKLPRAKFRVASLLRTDMSEADLTGADLSATRAEFTKFRGTKLNGAKLVYANFKSCDLSGADLRGADLTSARFDGCTMEGADLTGAKLSGAYFGSSRMKGARIGDAVIQETYWYGGQVPAQFR